MTVALASRDGLVSVRKNGIFDFAVETVTLQVADGVLTTRLSGEIKPLVAGIDWPTFQIRELAIDSEGNVNVEGGWIDLPDQYSLDFHGFQMAISRMGFGKTEDGGKWIGFSGALKLVEGLSAGASAEGLRIIWYDDEKRVPRLTLEGVGVEFEVPDVLRFRGFVSWRELIVAGEQVRRFDGSIRLELLALDLELDATLVVGTATGPAGAYTFFAIYLGAELPAGIPLWSTGLALYGIAGLFAVNMEPNRAPGEPWYGIGSEGWYHRPETGVTDLRAKWVNKRGSLALGAGVTIGTVADNGFTFNGRMLLMIVFPGPILMIEGRANLLRERASLSSGEPIFRALAVLDGREGTLTLGVDAQYKIDEDAGRLLDIHGGAEAFFSLTDASAWHLYLGLKDPREKRIRAGLFSLFEANSYFMLDANQLALRA
ncbi:MAG: hypothetical protein WKF37_17190 [Bryobacteraceae bacterium]